MMTKKMEFLLNVIKKVMLKVSFGPFYQPVIPNMQEKELIILELSLGKPYKLQVGS